MRYINRRERERENADCYASLVIVNCFFQVNGGDESEKVVVGSHEW